MLIGYKRRFNGIKDLKQTVCVYLNVSVWTARVNTVLRKLEQAKMQIGIGRRRYKHSK